MLFSIFVLLGAVGAVGAFFAFYLFFYYSFFYRQLKKAVYHSIVFYFINIVAVITLMVPVSIMGILWLGVKEFTTGVEVSNYVVFTWIFFILLTISLTIIDLICWFTYQKEDKKVTYFLKEYRIKMIDFKQS